MSEPTAIAMTLEEAATALNLDTRSVVKLLGQGQIRGNRVGRIWRISKVSVEAWLAGGVPFAPAASHAVGGKSR